MTQHNKTSYVDRRNIFKVIEHLSQTVKLTYDEIHHEVPHLLPLVLRKIHEIRELQRIYHNKY
jgi:hypothetical protein